MRGAHWLVWPALAVLVGLGVWQLQRLEWKTALIDTIATRGAAPPGALPRALDPERPETWEFTRVALSGRWRHDAEMRLQAQPRAGRVGVRLVTPLDLEDGRAVLVDRGWAPDADSAERPPGAVALEGLLRGPPADNPFRPRNRPDDGAWYWLDPAAMARAAGLPARAFYVLAVAPEIPAAPGRYPVPGGAALELRNDHLQYALTWFGLAAALLAVWLAARRRARAGAA